MITVLPMLDDEELEPEDCAGVHQLRDGDVECLRAADWQVTTKLPTEQRVAFACDLHVAAAVAGGMSAVRAEL